MSIVSYDGILLPYAINTNFSQDVLYDDSTTDWYLTKFDIEVTCTITVDYLASLVWDLINSAVNPPTPTTGNPAVIMRALQERLKRPRRKLSFTLNGVDLIPNIPTASLPGCIDAKNGPIPQSCKYIELNHETFLLSYRIVAHYWVTNRIDTSFSDPAKVINTPTTPVLNNRWSETVEIDNCNYTRRTRDGKYIIRSDNAAGKIADEFRNQLAVVAVPPGFMRESSRYTVDPSGLAIAYQVVDKEYFKPPPTPAFTAQGTYTESATVNSNASVRQGSCRIRLQGAKNTPQNLLINYVTIIVMGKLFNRGAQFAGQPFGSGIGQILTASLSVGMYENTVEMEMSALYSTRKGRLQGAVGFSTDSGALTGTPYPTNAVRSTPKYTIRGTANILLRAASYYDPKLADLTVAQQDAAQSTVSTQPNDLGVSVGVGAGSTIGQPGTRGLTREAN